MFPVWDDLWNSIVLITSADPDNKRFGTGFSIWREGNDAWFVTCAHVVADVGGAKQVRVNAQPAEVVACGGASGVDLAVLRAAGLDIRPLTLGLNGAKDMACYILGCSDLDGSHRKRQPLDATVGSRADFTIRGEDWFRAWLLRITSAMPLGGGYSGSPVLCARTQTVFAVVSHKADLGGYAISLQHLSEIWPDRPAGLLRDLPAVGGGPVAEHRPWLDRLFQHPPVAESTLRAWCRDALPRSEPLSIPAANGLDLLDWLIRRGCLSNGQAPVLTVLQQLLPCINAPEDRARAQDVIAALARHFGVSTAPRPAPPPAAPPVLMMHFSLAAPGKQWDVQGWLFYSSEQIFQVCARTLHEETAVHVDDSLAQTEFVEALRNILGERDVDPDRVMVEFLLPLDLIFEAVEQWRDAQGDPLGAWFPVVVRPSERQRQPALQLGWRPWWQRCQSGVFPKGLWWYERGEESWRRQVRGQLHQGVCVALGFVPNGDTLQYLIHAGAPIILWPRRNEGLADVRQTLLDWLADRPLCDLPHAIHALRRRLWEDQGEQAACYHLTLLWDDPDRRPPLAPQQEDDFYRAPDG